MAADGGEVAPVGLFGESVTAVVIASADGGSEPKLALSPVELDFGIVQLGSTASRKIRLFNVGFSDLEILNITPAQAGGAFATYFTSPFTIPPRGQVLLTVEFRPGAAGPFATELLIDGSDSIEPHRVLLRGRTTPATTPGRVRAAGFEGGD